MYEMCLRENEKDRNTERKALIKNVINALQVVIRHI